ncbi:type IV conjugative transfer system protein TraL [Thauera aminoaromatica]|jgi:conjugal transfer pilus assembly protein TraL|uniref:Type IV conjugative transfer system protein TraL n=1 Tax=Thauera aminoaromatica TaxID=164330 RepID=A0A5C7T9G1_THASP|nr:type IV conjugative transfer system protein TraL [Thauera aminoaromatica]TXH92270.1 MAG: type IV conjugative transfer system protein TraL [Thauera aminoaromatica]
MNEERRYLVPQRLDDPPKFLWWDFDVALIFMGTLVFGLAVGYILSFVLLGAVLASMYQKTKVGQHRAFGMHLMYWYLPVTFGFKRTPPSCIREFIG